MSESLSLVQRPVVGVGAIVWKGDRVLLIRRGHDPHRGRWSLPGGRQELGETIYEAVHREILEETGVTISISDVTAVVDVIERESGGVRAHYTVIDVTAEWIGGEAVAGDDAEAVAWAAPAELAAYTLTQAVQDVIAKSALQRAAEIAS
jgi:ADP-ribose pyrophosphatase YjhB (NUDIX family)